ncbi:ankyrin repeat-containing protein ITN1-like isoform X2 [Arachis duranensis]|uniref:Ankyrin repeat-containing protein ITN1-like isoform X2 n=1 Tax=Arachis duranensis TaxID=130453 RepID=A0A9C6TY30_ARADU|nr:ankyrin repeat-containing protein ITN1-like isoform X2 [Arachis duranensis]
MAAATNINIASTGIVLEALTKDNYDNWSTLVKNYLVGQGLWRGIVEADQNNNNNKSETEEWISKNAKALHAIQLACGSENLSNIRKFEKAREAWNHLKISFSKDVRAFPDSDQKHGSQVHRLHSAVKRGYWNDAKSYINRYPDSIFCTASSTGRTVLHVAVASGKERIVKELVNMGNQRLLKMQDKRGYTALALVAELTDNVAMAEMMVVKGGEELLTIRTKQDDDEYVGGYINDHQNGEIPVLIASKKGHKEMTAYLFSKTPPSVFFEKGGRYGIILLTRCIYAEIFDVAASLIQHRLSGELRLDPESESVDLRPIYALAHMPSAFLSGTQLGLWQRYIYHCLKLKTLLKLSNKSMEIILHVDPDDTKANILANLIATSPLDKISNGLRKLPAKYGLVEFIDSMRHANPDLLWAMDKNERGIFSHAIAYRHDRVFRFIHEIEGRKEMIASREDVFDNNILHLAAELGPSSYLGRFPNSALQMQKELQWFKAVERIVPAKCKEAKNADGKKPRELFTKTHEELVKSGEKWARDIAGSFTLVGTLIITMMFAAAFTVPGGNDQNTGIPIFLKKRAFKVFIIADAVSLITSSSSVLSFIWILTSRYAENDFLWKLPVKLLLGLITLFFSVLSMMIAFVSALFMMLEGNRGVVIATTSLAVVPVLVLIPTLLILFFEILVSTLRSPKLLTSKKKNKKD